MYKSYKIVYLIILISIIGMGLSCTTEKIPKNNSDFEASPIPVSVAKVEKRSIQRTIPLVGTLYGYEELNLAPKVDGRIVKIRHDVSDVVLPGATLLELDEIDYQLEVEAQRRAFEAELARLGINQLPIKDNFDPLSIPLVRRAEVAYINAKSEYMRAKALAEKSVTSNREFEAAEMEFRAAEATRNDAKTQAQALFANAQYRQAMLKIAEQRLADTKLSTPIPVGWDAWSSLVGVAANPMKYQIAARYVSEGEMVRSMPVTNAFRVVVSHILKLKASVPEKYISEIKVDMPVAITVDSYSLESFAGVISRINPTVDIATRTFQIEIHVANFNGKLKSGSFARALVQTKLDHNIQTVPTRSIVTFAGVTKLFQYDQGRARAVQVAPGIRGDDWVEIRGSIDPNMLIITTGLSKVVDGAPVVIQ